MTIFYPYLNWFEEMTILFDDWVNKAWKLIVQLNYKFELFSTVWIAYNLI